MKLTGLKQGFRLSLTLCAAALLAGCYYDPNPPRVFPGSASSAVTGGGATNGSPMLRADGEFALLRVGDGLDVSFADVPPLSMRDQRIRIPDSGIITLPFNVRVQAAGKTTSQLEKDIRDAYVPSLFVTLTAIVRPEERSFVVDGEVKIPGQKPYIGEMTVLRAIGSAGGFTEFANRKKIQLRRQGGQTFYVNWKKAIERSELDLPVYPNDHIYVDKTIW